MFERRGGLGILNAAGTSAAVGAGAAWARARRAEHGGRRSGASESAESGREMTMVLGSACEEVVGGARGEDAAPSARRPSSYACSGKPTPAPS
jgi:hypothetical protein